MTKSEVKHTLKSELQELNKIIDYKILKGLPYGKEARQHKMLRARLSLLNRSTFLARTMRVAHIFML